MYRRALVAMGVLVLAAVTIGRAQEPAAPAPARPAAGGADAPVDKQYQVASQYRALEETLLRIAQKMERGGNAEARRKALVIVRALDEARKKQIAVNLSQLAEELKKPGLNELKKAIDRGGSVKNDLEQLLNLLMADESEDSKKKEKDFLANLAKELDKAIRDQRAARQQNSSDQVDKDQAQKAQEVASAQAKNVLDKIKEFEAMKKGIQPDAAKDKKDGDKGDKKDGQGKDNKDSKDGKGKDSQGKDDKKDGKGDPKDGKDDKNAKDGKGDPKKDGKPDQGDKKDGKGDPKDGKGDPKKGDPKDGKGDPKDQKNDPKDSKGEPKDNKDNKGDQKDSKGQPKEGEPKDGKPQNGKPKNGQPMDGDGQQGDQQDQKKDDAGEDDQQDVGPSRKRVQDANDYQKKAQEKIEKDKRNEAVPDQVEAERKLAEARKKLEEILRQMREEETERVLADLQRRCEKMLQMQEVVNDGTRKVDQKIQQSPEKTASREEEVASRRLADKEEEILVEADKALAIIQAEGSAVAFAEVFTQVRSDVATVAKRLGRTDVGAETQIVEDDIVTMLKQMIDAFKKARQDNQNKKNQPPPQKGGQQGPQSLVDMLAELRLIRSMQLMVNNRTAVWGKRYRGEQTQAPEIVKELQDLARRQLRIAEIVDNLAKGKNR